MTILKRNIHKLRRTTIREGIQNPDVVPRVAKYPVLTSNVNHNEISSVALLAFIMVVVISLKHVNAGVSETFQEVSRCRTRTQLHEGEALNPKARESVA